MTRPQRLILSVPLFVLLMSFASLAVAQPGNEGQIIHGMVNSLQERIAAASQQLKDNPHDAQLYDARGSRYLELYRALNENYYRYFYGPRPPELTAAAIATKAIMDFDRAIEISPSAELYDKRGEMYEALASDFVREMKFNTWETYTNSPGDAWTLLTRPPTEKLELAAFGRLVTNPDFASAAKDYTQALRLNQNPELAKEIHAKFARLYLSRIGGMPLVLPSIKKIVDRPNQYHYSIWADFDSALEHLSKSDAANEQKLFVPECQWFCVWSNARKGNISRSQIYSYKAMIAISYDKYEMALDALNSAEKYFDPERYRYDIYYNVCELYSMRSRLHVTMGNYDAAIADASHGSRDGSIVCGRASEARGDAYFAKGNWQSAIDDYTSGLSNWTSNTTTHAYKNRALAYLKLGETEKAITDLTYYLNAEYNQQRVEDLRLRAQAYRKVGREDLAVADEKRAKDLIEDAKSNAKSVNILGEIKMPAGVPFDNQKVEVLLIDAADPKKRFRTTVGADGRFIMGYEKGRSFTIHVFHDSVKDGKPVRLFGQTRKLTAHGMVGPITITLDRIARKE